MARRTPRTRAEKDAANRAKRERYAKDPEFRARIVRYQRSYQFNRRHDDESYAEWWREYSRDYAYWRRKFDPEYRNRANALARVRYKKRRLAKLKEEA
jgi:hypothetical protein